MFKLSSDFNDLSKTVLLLWIPFVIYISRLSILYGLVCSLRPCDHLTSWLSCFWCFLVFLSLSQMFSRVRCCTWLYRFLIFAFFFFSFIAVQSNIYIITPGRRQSNTLLPIYKRVLKLLEVVFSIAICRQSSDKWQSKTLFLTILIIARNSIFDCHLSPVGWQMAFDNSVCNDFWSTFVDSNNVFDCRLSGVINGSIVVYSAGVIWC